LIQEYKTYAYFSVKGFDCDYTEITKVMGIEPSRAHNKGSSHSKTPQIKRKTSVWALYSSKPETEVFLDSHIESVLHLIEPKRERIKELASKYYVGIQCVGYYTNANPGFHMSAELIQRVAALGLWMDFDLYCSCEEAANSEQ
jgi:hypothetical protein